MKEKIYKFSITETRGNYNCEDYGTFDQLSKLFYQTKIQIETELNDCNLLKHKVSQIGEDHLSQQYLLTTGSYINLDVAEIRTYEDGDDFGEEISDFFKEEMRH